MFENQQRSNGFSPPMFENEQPSYGFASPVWKGATLPWFSVMIRAGSFKDIVLLMKNDSFRQKIFNALMVLTSPVWK
jgi:hypothetical protein